MHILSVNTGTPRPVRDGDAFVTTAIRKTPREGAVRVGLLSLEGDGQADLSNHGGRDKAVYAYAAEHYEAWRAELPGVELPWGAFGENLSLHGLDVEALGIGDELRVGSARMRVTMPRIPCAKLGLRLGRPDAARRMAKNGRCGCYLRVVDEGEVRAGDPVQLLEPGSYGISVAQLFGLIMSDDQDEDADLLHIASTLPTIPESARERFAKRLAAATGR